MTYDITSKPPLGKAPPGFPQGLSDLGPLTNGLARR